MPKPDHTPPHEPTLPWRPALALGLVVAVLQGLWVAGLPFQLDDYFVLRDPAIGFHAEQLFDGEDVPPFMCRIPMWILWMVTTPLAGEPPSPFVFHAIGLLLHGLCAALVARCLGRFTTRRLALGAGALSGLAGGAMQAVSWTAAWSSLTYTLFGLIALDALYQARTQASRRRWMLWCFAGAAVALSLLSKAPGAVVPGVLGALVLAESAARRLRGRALFEFSSIATGALVGWFARRAFLGSSELGYFASTTPTLSEVFARLPNGFGGLGQALVPWNLDALFVDQAPVLHALTGGAVSAQQVALVVFGLPILTALCFGPRRILMGALLIALIPAVVPLAMLFDGQLSNVAGRSAYLPLPLCLGLWAIAVASLFQRSRASACRISVCIVGALGVLTLVDGTVHVARTERAMARHVIDVQTALRSHAQTQPPATMLAMIGDGGFGGIPSLGAHVQIAAKPPFFKPEASHSFDVLVARDGAELNQVWRRGELNGAAGIRRLSMLPGAPVELGLAHALPAQQSLVFGEPTATVGGVQYTLTNPVQRLYAGWLEFKAGGLVGPDARVELLLNDEPQVLVTKLTHLVAPDGRVRFELAVPADLLASGTIHGLRILGVEKPTEPRLRLPGPLGLPGARVDSSRPLAVYVDQPLLIPAALGADGAMGLGAPRLELTLFDTHGRSTSVYCDTYKDGFRLDSIHESPQAPPHGASAMPWADVASSVLLHRLRNERYRWLRFEATTLLISADGQHVLARSAPATGRLVDPEAQLHTTTH